ncbi:MAG: SDR family NAD(P)-dependent oxidoreductase [Candidatus Hydrogenedentes bacterium]|nr:SDR family NAD(P)-dependent oxidoreductase [Candidatus Hydrogenedentota bacterium]
MAKRFDDKTAFITGASSGIGAAVAEALAREGARVALAARRIEKLDDVRKRVESAAGVALPVVCDVRDKASLDEAVRKTVEAFGGIDVALANAGFGVVGQFVRLDTDAFRAQFETNVFGVINTIYAALPHLLASKGRLGIVSSVQGRVAMPSSSPYNASKFAVYGLAESLYYELAPKGVSVVCIQPGFVASEIRQVDNNGRFEARRRDSAPNWLIVPTEKAARDIVNAVYRRRFDAVITGHAKLMAGLSRHFPRLTRAIILKSTGGNVDPKDKPKRRPRSKTP